MFLQLSNLPLLVFHQFFVYFYHCYYLFYLKRLKKKMNEQDGKKETLPLVA